VNCEAGSVRLFAFLKIGAVILLAVMDWSGLSSAHADDPAYYKLVEAEDLTFYKRGDTELRPTFSFETVGFQQINPGWGKRNSPFGDLGKAWFEIAVTPGIQGTLGLGGYGKLDGRLSGVFTYTGGGLDGAGTNPPPDTHPSAFLLEDAYLRWSSGDLMPFFGKDGVELSAGAQRFRVGSGFLVWSGSSNGGSRGAFWLGARRAFENTVVLRLRKDGFSSDFFYLTPNDNPDTSTDVLGTNLEYNFSDSTQVAFMYLKVLDSDRERRDGLNAFDFRGKISPLSSLPGLQLSGELVLEENGNKVRSALGGYAGIAYEFADVLWKPRVGYRFSGFSGDRLGKTPNKAFDPLFYGQSDWGTWFQGEILGNYITINQNLLSHLVRLELRPVESVTLNLLYFHFRLAQLTTTDVSRDGAVHTVNVNSKNLGDEVNFAVDWAVNKHLVFTGLYGFNVPGKAARQFTGDSKVWSTFMLYMGVRI
jgi:Alginate export